MPQDRHALKLSMVKSNGMLPVKFFHSKKAVYVSAEFHGYNKIVKNYK